MISNSLDEVFTHEALLKIFPEERTNEFFEALFGDADEGSFDIELAYRGMDNESLTLELLLHERPGCCLACNLTQGLPQVFSRHPVIDMNSIFRDVDNLMGGGGRCKSWSLGHTEQRSSSLHVIPIRIVIQKH